MVSPNLIKTQGITGLPRSAEFGVLALVSAGLLWFVRAKLTFDPVTYTAHFADEKSLLGIPNFWNVITNLGFIFVGVHGIRNVSRISESLRFSAGIFLVALISTAFGSAYFHWATSPQTLFWDQLPMSIGFGSFVGMVVADRVNVKFGHRLGLFLCFLGPWTVWSIYYANGSTTPYLALQFGSLLLSALLLLVMPNGELGRGPIFLGILVYVFAKVFEHFDFQIYERLGFISGHSLKHIAAALALMAIFRGMEKDRATL